MLHCTSALVMTVAAVHHRVQGGISQNHASRGNLPPFAAIPEPSADQYVVYKVVRLSCLGSDVNSFICEKVNRHSTCVSLESGKHQHDSVVVGPNTSYRSSCLVNLMILSNFVIAPLLFYFYVNVT
jgi:hypothetical protein